MRVSLFGPLRLRIGDRLLGAGDFGGAKTREVLEILLLARGKAVSKEVLGETLWPRTQPKNAVASIETYISVLRKTLFADKTQAKQVIQTVAGGYRFVLDGVTVDLDEFDLLIARSQTGDANQFSLRVQAAEMAFGDLLEDARDAMWVEADRELYRDRVTRINVLVAEEMVARGDYSGAIKHGERAMAIRPYSEEAVRSVMRANLGLGQNELSRQAYQRFCTLLASDMNVDCSTETAELAGAIDAGAPIEELLEGSGEALGRDPSPQRRDRRDLSNRLPFLGRSQELDRVRQVVAISREEGRFSVVLVKGRPGSGRSAFLNELSRRLSCAVGMSRYMPMECENPKLPLADAISKALEGTPQSASVDQYRNAPFLGGGGQALLMLKELLSVNSPIVFLLDDFQWADPASLKVIEWLHANASHLPVTIVAAVRETEKDKMSVLEPRIVTDTVHLGALRECDWIEIDGLDPSLMAATGGFPAIMADCHRWSKAGRPGVSPSATHSIMRMVRGLDEQFRDLLRAASLKTEPFSTSDWPVEDKAEAAMRNCLERLCELDLLGQAEGKFEFRSSLVRDVLANAAGY
jgi:DNA-binding SARP family transcriptional activator